MPKGYITVMSHTCTQYKKIVAPSCVMLMQMLGGRRQLARLLHWELSGAGHMSGCNQYQLTAKEHHKGGFYSPVPESRAGSSS